MVLLHSYVEMVKSNRGLFLCLTTLTQRNDGKIFSSKLAGQSDFLSECPALLRGSMVGCRRWMVAHLRGSEDKETSILPPLYAIIRKTFNALHKMLRATLYLKTKREKPVHTANGSHTLSADQAQMFPPTEG